MAWGTTGRTSWADLWYRGEVEGGGNSDGGLASGVGGMWGEVVAGMVAKGKRGSRGRGPRRCWWCGYRCGGDTAVLCVPLRMRATKFSMVTFSCEIVSHPRHAAHQYEV